MILTEQRNELSFHVVDPRGAPTTKYVAVVFPVDERLWSVTQNIHLHVATFPPFGGLVPGEYYAIAVEDGIADDLVDPTMLRRLAQKALKFQIREAETRRIELRRVP